MTLILLMFLAAIFIAGISAYFSIFGLIALFSASPIAIAIAGGVTEFGKLVLVSYFYRFRKTITVFGKSIMTFIIATVMAVTSIGIFGFLSSAYLEHTNETSSYDNKIGRVESKINSQQNKLERNKNIIEDLDAAYEKYIEINYISRALEKREEQKEQREKIKTRIRDIEEQIGKLRDKKNSLESQKQRVEAQIGPIKYFAMAVFGENEDAIDKSVELMIILLIIILDPFAVTILVCANHAHVHRDDERLKDEITLKTFKNNNLNTDNEENRKEVESEEDNDIDKELYSKLEEELEETDYNELAERVKSMLDEEDSKEDNDNNDIDDNIDADNDGKEKVGKYFIREENDANGDNSHNSKNNSWLPR